MVVMQGVTDGPRPGRRETGLQGAPSGPTPRPRRPWHDRRAWRVSPRAFQRIAGVAVWALILTIVSGAAVRLTGSGLGCPDWPNCTASDVMAPLQFHAWVEFGNRLINAAITVAALGAFAAAWLRAPRRRDLTLLAGGLVVGLLAEVGLGALVVQSHLAPGLVMTHFLLGLVFLVDAVLLHRRSAVPDEQATVRRVPLVSRSSLLLARLQLAATIIVVTLGTVVTSTGPHGGDPHARRFGFSLHTVAQLHGTSVEILLVLTLVTMWNLARTRPWPGHAPGGDCFDRHGRPGGGRLHPVFRRRSRGPGRRARRRGVCAGRRHAPLLPGPVDARRCSSAGSGANRHACAHPH